MNVLKRKTLASIVSLSVALLTFSTFQTVGNAADTKLNISDCVIKDKTLSYTGNISEGEIIPVTIMARQKDNPSDIRYMRIVTPDDDGSFTGSIKIYDKESTADLFDMEVLFQADEDVPAVTFALTYFNDKKKNENVDKMGTSVKGMLDFMTSDNEGMKIYNNMGVRLDLYNAQESAIKNKINTAANGFKVSATAENVVEIANGSIYAILAGEVKSANDLINIIGGFDEESKTLQIKKNSVADTERYSKLSNEDQAWIASNVYANMPKEGFNDYEELYKAVRKSIFLRFVNTTHYMELNELILSNTDILENEMTQLRNTTNVNVLDTTMGDIRRQAESSNFTNIETFIGAVDSALTKASSENGSGSSSGGSSGGGVSSGGTSSGGGIKISLMSGDGNSAINPETINNSFNDLAGYDWAVGAIKELAAKGIVNGISDDRFEPGRNITREEFVKLICTAFDLGIGSTVLSFEDVGENDWFAPYICRAVELGIIEGISDTQFGTGISITREDMAVMIYRSMEKIGIELTGEGQGFSDENDIAEYAKHPINVLSGNNIINGVGDDMFAPKKNAGRAEAAVIIHRCMEKLGR